MKLYLDFSCRCTLFDISFDQTMRELMRMSILVEMIHNMYPVLLQGRLMRMLPEGTVIAVVQGAPAVSQAPRPLVSAVMTP